MKSVNITSIGAIAELPAASPPTAFRLRQALDSTSYKCEILDPLSNARWESLVTSHPESHIFHSSAWARVLSKTYRHRPFYLHLVQDNKTLALVPVMEVASVLTGRRGVCLPFSDFCSPLLFEKRAETMVLNELSKLAENRRWKFCELRDGAEPETSAVPSSAYYTHKIDLTQGADQLFASFADSVRRAIRKAAKSGVITEISQSRESLSIFYRLHLRTRRRHGVPPQPFKFFLNIQEELMENNAGFIVLSRADSHPIAGAVFLLFGDNAIYKYAASDERYQQMRGNDVIMWEGIKFLTQGRARTLHLGRTSIDNDGLRKFKLGWNVTEEMLHYFRFDVTANSWLTMNGSPGNLHKQVFGRLPLAVNKLAGTMIYPHLD